MWKWGFRLTALIAAASSINASRETVQEAAVHARDLVAYRSDGLGTLISVYANDYADQDLAGHAIGLMEYYAPNDDGDLYILAMPVSSNVRNILQSPNHNATFSIMDQAAERHEGRIGATDRNRVALFGHLEKLTEKSDVNRAAKIFGLYHKDAKAYYPPQGPHYAFWAVLRVDRVYWLGGFGDRHYIGWVPHDMYRSVKGKPDRKAVSLVVQQPFIAT